MRRVSASEGYALWAQTYDHQPNPLLALEERELDLLLPNLKGKDVIDAACGTGRWLEKLLSCGARRGVGVDISAAMLARAAAKPSLQGRLVRGDGLALPFQTGIADLAVCSFAAGYISDLRGLACVLARVARRRADLFVTDFHPLGHQRGWRRAFRHGEETVEIASRAHSLEQICRAFQTEGFELRLCHQPRLGEPERPIFEEAGKGHTFDAACLTPAIFICHFKFVGEPSWKEI